MLSQMRTHIQSWWQQTPLPTTSGTPTFQQWHHFNQQRWVPFISPNNRTPRPSTNHQWAGSFRLVTWNANTDTQLPQSRISALLHAVQTTAAADVLFLQEVSRDALTALLANSWIQHNWYVSEASVSAFHSRNFISITLVCKTWIATAGIQLGAIWRIALPSHFGRDALCCDVIFNASATYYSAGRKEVRIRLINVHLDSLPINPSLRPQQLALCTAYLRAAGRGIVAGDFNPVLEQDEELVSVNGLVDAWARLKPGDPGYTWGVHGEQRFPPDRMDKVAVLELKPLDVGILQTRELGGCGEEVAVGRMESELKVRFSDHLGVWCDVGWEDDRIKKE